MSLKAARVLETRAAVVELEISIAATRERVWEAFIAEIDQWWPADFRMGAGTKAVVFERQIGGRVYEDGGDGAGLLWFNVLSLSPPESMHLSGELCPPYGGPATTQLYVALESTADGATTLKITNAIFGHFSDSSLEGTESGWRELFEGGLKNFVEGAAKR